MKYIICLLLFVSWQPIPKWKYIVFTSTHMESGAGLNAQGRMELHYKDFGERFYFPTSKKAWKYFNDNVVKRNGQIYFQGSLVTKVWIDSVVVK